VHVHNCTILVVLPDPENISIAVGIFLLSCIQTKIYVFS